MQTQKPIIVPVFRGVLSLAAVVCGMGIVVLSLVSASHVRSTGEPMFNTESGFEDEMLPDHVLYPLLMARDKVTLELATPEQRIEFRLEYAKRRMQYAFSLIRKNKYELALTTATKAQKYVLAAYCEAQSQGLSPEHQAVIRVELKKQTSQLRQIQAFFPGEGNSTLSALIAESEALTNTL